MFSKILIATDLSATSYYMIEALKELKNYNVQNIILTHVIDLKYTTQPPQGFQEESMKLLNKESELLIDAGFNVQLDLRVGSAWKEILESAREHKATLIVVGSHGKSIAREVILGSVTSELIEQADLPVLILKMSDFDTERKARYSAIKIPHLFDNVLYATDFSPESENAKNFLKQNIGFIKKLTLLHVQEPIILEQPIEFDQSTFDAIDLKRLEDIEKELGISAQREILHGIPSLEIESFINSDNFTLVVMGTRGFGLAARILLGSTSRHTVRHSKSPVLIVPKNK